MSSFLSSSISSVRLWLSTAGNISQFRLLELIKMRVCPHVNQMDLDKVVFNMQDLLAVDVDYVQEEQENNKMAIFLSNRKNDAWVCLNVDNIHLSKTVH